MSVRTLTCNFRTLLAGAVTEASTVNLYLEDADHTGSYSTVKSLATTTTDASGDCSFANLVPNVDGSQAQQYRIELIDATTHKLLLNESFTMPDADSSLHNLIGAAAISDPDRVAYLDSNNLFTGTNTFGTTGTGVTTVFVTGITADTIGETTAAAGVTVDGVLIKDGAIETGAIGTAVTGVTQSAGDNSTLLATTAYADAALATVDTWAEVLALGNTSGGTDVIISAGDSLTVDTITPTSVGPVTIQQTNAQNALVIDQDGTLAALRIDQSSNQAAIDINNPSTTSSNVIRANDADALTTGAIALLVSNSASTGTRNLVDIVNDNALAVNAIPLRAAQDADNSAAFFSGTGTLTGNVLKVSGSALTTGRLASFYSNSDSIGNRELVQITNDNAAAANATVLKLQQDGAYFGLFIDANNAASTALVIDTEATTTNVMRIQSPATTTGAVFDARDADALTTGQILDLQSDSASTSTRNLVQIVNDNILAVNATPLQVQNDASGSVATFTGSGGVTVGTMLVNSGLITDSSGAISFDNENISTTGTLDAGDGTLTDTVINGRLQVIQTDTGTNALNIDSSVTTTNTIVVPIPDTTSGVVFRIGSADSLTTGSIAQFESDSSSAASRKVVFINNDNTLASNTVPLHIQQDADYRALFIDQNGSSQSIHIDSESTTTATLYFHAPANTTGGVISLFDASSLTTGSGLKIDSDSASTSTRNLVDIVNDNSLATSAVGLSVKQDSSAEAVKLAKGTTDGGFVNFTATADADAVSAISTLTTSGAVTHHIQIEINGTKAWIPVSTTAPT